MAPALSSPSVNSSYLALFLASARVSCNLSFCFLPRNWSEKVRFGLVWFCFGIEKVESSVTIKGNGCGRDS